MICGIDVDALIGGLQDKLNEAKDSALAMVDQLAADAKVEAEKLKESMESEIRGWMAELPELPELPKIPMSVEMMALASKLAGYAKDLANEELPQDAKDAIAQEMAKAKKAFKDEWGEALDKQGIDLDKILDALNGGGDIDPCALIPNLQKGVDGLITMAPNMPTFPIEGALKEIKSEISAVATEAKGAIDAVGEVVSANVGVVAKQMQKVQDSASSKTAADMKKSRKAKSPANSKTSTIQKKIVDVKEHKQFVGMDTVILLVDDFEPETRYSHGHFWFFNDMEMSASGAYKGRTVSGEVFIPGPGKVLNNMGNEIYADHIVIDFGWTLNEGNKATTEEAWAANNVKLKEIKTRQAALADEFLSKKTAELEADGYTFVSGKFKTLVQVAEKNPNGSHDSYYFTHNVKIYTKNSQGWFD